MNLPIPTHLKTFLLPIGNENSEFEVTGKIQCACGNEAFEIWESNDRQIVKLVCKQCKNEFILFDAGKHGWNGFVCRDDFLDRERPFEKYVCSKCNETVYSIIVYISSQGKEDFIKECLLNDDSFTVEDWVDAFEWITISLSCENCGLKSDGWLDLETI